MKFNTRFWFVGASALVAIWGLLGTRAIPTHQTTVNPVVVPAPKAPASAPHTLTPEQRTATLNAYAKLPLSFEPSNGRAGVGIDYFSRGHGYSLFLAPTEAVLLLRKSSAKNTEPSSELRMTLDGANPAAKIFGDDVMASKNNYFFGNDPSKYYTGVKQYKKVRSTGVYSGIDMVYYGNQSQLEYDFVVAPGANPSAIRMAFKGSEKIEVNPAGELVIHIGESVVTQHKPVIYQTQNGVRKPVAGGYEIVAAASASDNRTFVGFHVADYDRAAPLTIDPVLVYATFYGDTPQTDHSGDDIGMAVAIDASGAAYVVGKTNTFEIPLKGPFEIIPDPIDHAKFPTRVHTAPEHYHGFVTKFQPNGADILFSTFLGGTDDDQCRGVAVDQFGNVFICGATKSGNFPIKNALHAFGGSLDAFVTKIDPAGANILFSTYLGGSGDDQANDIAVDSAGNVLIVGTTASSNFVTAHPLQSSFGGGATDAFVAKFSGDGSVNNFCTFLGGTGADEGNGIAVDASGNVFVTGSTTSNNFPIALPYQTNSAGGRDAFVTKLNSSGSLLIFSTYIGGSGDDAGNGIAVDNSGNIYITGSTTSTNYPTVSPTILPVQSVNGGPLGTSDAFVSKFNVFGSQLIFSTYLGGKMNDVGKRVKVDSRNAIYVSGTTTLTPDAFPFQNDFPVAPQANTLQSGHSGLQDGFLAKFNPTGTPLVFSTYIGSSTHLFVTDNGAFQVQDFNKSKFFYYLLRPSVITAASEAGNVVTVTTSTNHGLKVNDVVVIDGATPVEYNGTFTVTSIVDTQNFTVTNVFNNLAPAMADNNGNFGTVTSKGFYADPFPYSPPQTDFNNVYLLTDGTLVYSTVVYDPNNPNNPNYPANSTPLAADFDTPTSVSVNGMACDNAGNAYLTGSTNGSFYFTFGAYSDIAPTFPIEGEDFPAPHIVETTDSNGNVIPRPSERNAGLNVDENDIIIAQVADNSPIITSPLSAQATKGKPFTDYTITATNAPLSYDAAGLPPGLSVSTTGGRISGVPTQDGIYNVVVTATNLSGTGSQIVIFSVSSAKPTMTSAASATANVGSVFQFYLAADNNPSTFTLNPQLPTGLSLDASTGLISGIPVVEGVYQFTTFATNANGDSPTQQFTLTVLPAIPVISSPVNMQALLNTPFSYAITATGNPQSYNATPNLGAVNNIVALPIGLQLDTVSGFITGSPNTLGFYKFRISATNGGGTGFQDFNLTVIPALVPVVSSSSSASGIYNEPFTFTITANNNPLSYGVQGALPTGLTLNDQTGVISGVPLQTGTFLLTQTAGNVAGLGTKPLTITINPPAVPVITSPLASNALVNAPFEYDIQAANHPTSYDAIGLPAGLAVDNTTGAITGTPTVFGTFNVTVQATNSGGTGSATLVLTVAPQQSPIVVSPNQANGFVGIPFNYQIVATANPQSYSAGGLPANLTVDANTGLISGIPAVAGVYSITLGATNPVGTGNKTLTLTVVPAVAPVITSPLAVNGIDGTPFTYRITATGIGPIVFSASGLPLGLSLVNDTIVGTPTNGTFNVLLTAFSPATNPASPGGPPNPLAVPPTTATLVITIAGSAAGITNSNLTATGTVGQPFLYTVVLSGSAPITLTASSLPAGLTLVGTTIQGTPTPAAVTLNGPFSVTLTATNAFTTNTVTKTLLITINAAKPSFTSSGFASGIDGVPFRYVIASTGTQVITYTTTALPPGLSLNGSIISGTPNSDAIGLSNVVITATNKGGSSTLNLGIQIAAAAPVLTIPASITGSAGVPFTFDLTATGSPQIDYTITNLPPGLVVDIDKIDGTPTTPGTYNVLVTATNPGGTVNAPLTIIINPAPPTITAAQINGFDGVPLVPFTLQVSGSTPITFSAPNLPPGIIIDALTGTISGTPTAPGSTIVTVTATNPGGNGTQQIVFNILASKPKITSPLSVQGTPGVPFLYTITATGTPAITFQVFNLPPGLTATGDTISGTPLGPVGKTSVTLLAKNAQGQDQQTLDIDIRMIAPTISNPSLQASGLQFAPFTFTLTAVGSPPISFGATGLPTGLTIDANSGVISGTPTVVGTFNVAVTATNPFGSDSGKTLVIDIGKSPPKITSVLDVNGGLNEPFTYTITASGSAVITFGATSLPPGLTLDINTGIISGTFSTQGTFTPTIIAANSAGTDSQTLTIHVAANPPVITSPLAVTASTIQNFTYTIVASGAPTLTYGVIVEDLPPGLTFSGNTISGIPAATGTFQVTITASNPLGTDVEVLVITVTNDTDGDGFPDDLEIFLGSDPNDPLSTPFVGPGSIRVLNVTAMSAKLNFKTPGVDTLTVKGTLTLDPNFNPAGKKAVIYVSGVIASINLGVKGSNSSPTFTMKAKPAGGKTNYSFSFGKGNFQTKLANVGMINADIPKPQTVGTLVAIFVNNTLYKSDKILTYTAHLNKNGTAKQSN